MKKVRYFILSRLFYTIITLLKWTYRIKKEKLHYYGEAASKSFNGVPLLAIWHEHSIPIVLGEVGRPYRPLVSRGTAGKITGYVMKKLGYWVAFGSENRGGANKGGAEVRSEVLSTLDSGYSPSFTVDGSSGPRRVCKAGVVKIAEKTGIPIIPLTAIVEKAWTLNTWDKMLIPKPFSKIHLIYGEPIFVPKGTTGESFKTFQRKVEQRLNESERQGLAQYKFPENLRYTAAKNT